MRKLVLFILFCFTTQPILADTLPKCRIVRSIKNLEDMFARSSGVYLVKVNSYEGSGNSDFGIYKANVISSLKGKAKTLEIIGYRPPKTIPQYYFDTTRHHASFSMQNLNANMGRPIIYENHGTGCQTYPDFILDYYYLVFQGVDHSLAFEAINSFQTDHWYQSARRIAQPK